MQTKKMKPIIIILVIILFVSCSATNNKVRTPSRLEVDSIEKVYLKKELYGTDSVKLSQNQIDQLVEKWNHSEPKGIFKMVPEFYISVHLKNDSIRRFRVNGDLIKESGDWAFSTGDSLIIKSLWTPTYSFLKPEYYTPLSFIKLVSQSIKTDSSKSYLGMSMTNEFPVDWVKEEHLKDLFRLLDSKEECGCFLSPFSSYIPSGKAEIGGYAGIFLKSFKDGDKVDLGLYSCPKVNESLSKELRNWRNEIKE